MKITDVKVGDAIPPLALEPVGRLEIIRYAGASGDFNPIHTIDEEAARAGLPGIIAHGMLTMGRMTRLFSPYLEQGYMAEFSTRFSGMVFLGDVLTYSAVAVQSEGLSRTFDVSVSNQKEAVVAKGQVKFVCYHS